MPPGYRFLVAPLQQSPSPRVTSCLCWLLPHPAACSFSTPFPSCQHFLAAEIAAGPGGQQGSSETFWEGGGSSPGTGGTGKFGIEEQTGAPWLARGCLEPNPAPAAAWLLLHPLTTGSDFAAGSGCAAPGAASQGGRAPGARSPSQCRAREVARRVLRPCPGQWLCQDAYTSRTGAAETSTAAALQSQAELGSCGENKPSAPSCPLVQNCRVREGLEGSPVFLFPIPSCQGNPHPLGYAAPRREHPSR